MGQLMMAIDSAHTRSRRMAGIMIALVLAAGGTLATGSVLDAGAGTHAALPASMNDLPPEKRALELAIIEDRENAPAAKKPDRDAARPAELAAAPKPWPHGLFQEREAPMSSSTFKGENRWVGDVKGRTLGVYAGLKGTSLTVGRVVIVRPNGHGIGKSWIVDAKGTGPLTIVKQSGNSLVLRDAHGKSHKLDLVTRSLS
jgi:hypothetical protein